ncbi:MAG TPA: aminotransferase class V-fold PLP-dependent enzyme, partial [candidate division Zixibacteria bacterium]|nr:aminotransferase class V-fold PLP-dependent enzyme [candidate division Zixibacteria bacterium]
MGLSSRPAAAPAQRLTVADLPGLLIGGETVAPTLRGPQRYVNFDNAASTPTFRPVAEAVMEFLQWYANVHRGTGFKSQLASWAFEEARDIIAGFIRADLQRQVVIFTKNTTEAINKLARRLSTSKHDVILTTLMEHHSNELPWRRVGTVVHVGLNADGTISREDFLAKLGQFGDRVRIVAISGASNVTGYINDLDFFARETHRAGASILVDAAQLAPHRPLDMKPGDPACALDYAVFSAHKMYAPFGIGVLVGHRDVFERGDPDTVGGGMVDIVTLEEAYWTDLPEKEEAGTPNIVGVVALAKAIRMYEALGWEAIIAHEAELTAHALRALNAWRDWFPDRDIEDATERGLEFLAKRQRSDGSWCPLWFGNQYRADEENPVYGTARVLLAYRDLGQIDSSPARRGLLWLMKNADCGGGWGGGAGKASDVAPSGMSSV